MTLFEYLDEAWEANDEAVLHFHEGGSYRSLLFEFVRSAKAHPELCDLDAMEALAMVGQWVAERGGWNNLPFLGIGQEDLSDDDFEAEFITVWDEVNYPAGEGPLEVALREAKQRPVTINGARNGLKGYVAFLSFALHLQLLRNGDAIFLSCRRIGELLGCSGMTISKYRKWAVDDGFLEEVKKHENRVSATEFRFVLKRFAAFKERP
jgi:hypothetical protein